MKDCKFYKFTGSVNGADTFSETPIVFEYYYNFRSWIAENFPEYELKKISFSPADSKNLKSVTYVRVDDVFIGFFKENTREMFETSPAFHSGE